MGDAADEWQVWRETSRAHQFCGEWETAIEVMEQALPVARRVNELTEAATHYELGALHARLRQFDQALAEYERARDIYRTAGQRDQEATTVNAMGVGYLDQGEYEQAEAAFDQALGMYASGQRDARVVTLCNLGDTYTDQARFEEARRVYRRGRSLARWTQNGEGQVYALRGMGRVEEALGRYRAAAHRYRQALTASRQYHGRADGAEMRFHVGMAYHKMGRDGRAWRWFERSRASFRKAGSRFAEAEPLMGMGLVCRSRGETAAALAYFRQALALAQADARFELERDLHDHIASLGAEPPEA
jgi:tetratricopeptide (TPR) repeat protein